MPVPRPSVDQARPGRRAVRPAVGIGAPTSIRTTPGRTQNRPRGITSSVPMSATGTTGAWALMAITNPPFLNGSRSPVRAARAFRREQEGVAGPQPLRGGVHRRDGARPVSAIHRHEADQPHGAAQHGQLPHLGLVEPAKPRAAGKERLEHHHVHVAAMIDAVEGRPVAIHVLQPRHVQPDAEQPADRAAPRSDRA